MTIAYKSSGAAKAYNGTQGFSAPAGRALNDVVFIVASSNNNGDTFSWPDGFNEIAYVSQNSNNLGVAWKRLTAPADLTGNYTMSASNHNFIAQAHLYSGLLTGADPFRTSASGHVQNADPALTLSALSADDVILLFTGCSATIDMAPPVGLWTLRGTTKQRVMLTEKIQPINGSSGSFNPVTSGTGRNVCVYAVALLADGGTGPTYGSVVVGGVRREITTASVIVGGVKKAITKASVVVGGLKRPLA